MKFNIVVCMDKKRMMFAWRFYTKLKFDLVILVSMIDDQHKVLKLYYSHLNDTGDDEFY